MSVPPSCDEKTNGKKEVMEVGALMSDLSEEERKALEKAGLVEERAYSGCRLTANQLREWRELFDIWKKGSGAARAKSRLSRRRLSLVNLRALMSKVVDPEEPLTPTESAEDSEDQEMEEPSGEMTPKNPVVEEGVVEMLGGEETKTRGLMVEGDD